MNSVYDRRLQLTNGEDCNGLELWRRLFIEHQGGAEQSMMAGIQSVHRFPRCPHESNLGGYLGEWLSLRRQVGMYLPEEYLVIMLMDVLPEKVASETRDRPLINATQKPVEYVSRELARYNDKHLAKVYDEQAAKALDGVHKNPIASFQDAEKRVADLMRHFDKMEQTICAFARNPKGGWKGQRRHTHIRTAAARP